MSCAGRCCAVFALPTDAIPRLEAGANGDDGPFILDMIVPLTPTKARSRLKRLGYDDDPDVTKPAGKRWFTCRHWDEETRLCDEYNQRPEMCRDFPYGLDCPHGCSCTDGAAN